MSFKTTFLLHTILHTTHFTFYFYEIKTHFTESSYIECLKSNTTFCSERLVTDCISLDGTH